MDYKDLDKTNKLNDSSTHGQIKQFAASIEVPNTSRIIKNDNSYQLEFNRHSAEVTSSRHPPQKY